MKNVDVSKILYLHYIPAKFCLGWRSRCVTEPWKVLIGICYNFSPLLRLGRNECLNFSVPVTIDTEL